MDITINACINGLKIDKEFHLMESIELSNADNTYFIMSLDSFLEQWYALFSETLTGKRKDLSENLDDDESLEEEDEDLFDD